MSDLAEPENRFEEQATKLLEVYLPIRTSGGSPLLFEATSATDTVASLTMVVADRLRPVGLRATNATAQMVTARPRNGASAGWFAIGSQVEAEGSAPKPVVQMVSI